MSHQYHTHEKKEKKSTSETNCCSAVYTSPLPERAHRDGCNTNIQSYMTTSNQVACTA